MGSSLSAFIDDYDVYKLLCEEVGVKPRPMDSGIYAHSDHICEIYGWEKTYFGYRKIDINQS